MRHISTLPVRVVAYDGIVEDVTERQRRDELLRRSERMASLGTTLAGVAHELNNPLAAIMGFTQLLLRKPWPSEDRAALETINHEAIRSATIVKDLLALTRKRDVERRVATNVNDIVGYIARTRRYALETAGIAASLSSTRRSPLFTATARSSSRSFSISSTTRNRRSHHRRMRSTPGAARAS